MKFGAMGAKAGFSLAEAALSLAIVGLVITAMVPAVLSLRASESARATQTALEAVMRASTAFVQANGCFPCPTPANVQTGQGAGVVRGDTSTTPSACGTCPTTARPGLVPYRSLGLPQSQARDGYGRWLTFAVEPALAEAGFSNLLCQTVDSDCATDDVTPQKKYKKGLCSLHPNATSPQVYAAGIAAPAAIVVLSHGANGRGAYIEGSTVAHKTFPPGTPNCSAGTAGAERCNADDNLVFVSATPVAGADPFDDQMLYYDRNALMTSLGGHGCDTSW